MSVVLKLYRKCTVPVRGEQKNPFPGPGCKSASPDPQSVQPGPGPNLKILEPVQPVPKILEPKPIPEPGTRFKNNFFIKNQYMQVNNT